MARLKVLSLLVVAAVAAALLAVSAGSVSVPPGEIVEILTGGGEDPHRAVILQLRLPRVLLALLVGGALGVSGAVFQALLRNPLADPYILGVSGGAAVGSVVVMVLGFGIFLGGVTVGALVGALFAVVLVLRLALAAGRGLDARILLLAGVIAGAFFNAIILLLLTIADAQSFRSAVFWMMGSLSRAGSLQAGALALFLLPCLALIGALARPLNLLAVGEETATYLGVPVERVKQAGYLAASLAVGASVAVTGIIGFVGLIIPHTVRMLWGGDHRTLLPASLLGGGIFLVLADTLARTIVAPRELPTGVITALVGVPLFAVLLVRSAR